MVKIEWDRLLLAFMRVEPTARFFFPLCITWSISIALFTTKVVRSLT
jgi:hypothetical protein